MLEIIPQCTGHPLSVRIRQGCLQSSSLLCGLRCFFTLPFLPFVPLTGKTPRVPFKNIIALFWFQYFNNYIQNVLSLFGCSKAEQVCNLFLRIQNVHKYMI